jgi:hypothetical protein
VVAGDDLPADHDEPTAQPRRLATAETTHIRVAAATEVATTAAARRRVWVIVRSLSVGKGSSVAPEGACKTIGPSRA